MNTRWAGAVLVVLSICVSIAFVVVAANRPLTSLENVLLQVISLGLGLVGSYVLGVASARETAQEMIRPHARSAFRRLLALYQGLSRVIVAIGEARPSYGPGQIDSSALDRLEAIVMEQIVTSKDSLEDWRDIVPEDVEELHKKLAEIAR